MSLGNLRARNRGRIYQCRAEHTSWIHPTDLLHNYHDVDRSTACTSPNRVALYTLFENVSDDYTDQDDKEVTDNKDPGKDFTEEDRNCGQEGEDTEHDVSSTPAPSIDKLMTRLRDAQKKVCEWKTKYHTLKKETLGHWTKCTNVSGYFLGHLGKVSDAVENSQQRSKRAARMIAETVLSFNNPNCFRGHLRAAFILETKRQLRRNVFSPQKILEAMDMAGGQLSMEGLEVLRTPETNNKKWVRGTLIPCSSDIQRCASVVEAFASKRCPYEHGIFADGGG